MLLPAVLPDEAEVFISVVMLLIGAIECFAGYRTAKFMVSVWAFFLGASAGIIIGFGAGSAPAAAALAVVIGAALAVLTYRFYLAGVFILTGSLVWIMVYSVTDKTVAAAAVGCAAGCAAVLFARPVMIVSTSVSGAAMLAAAACVSVGSADLTGTAVYMILLIALSAAGMACQFITTSRRIRRRLAGRKKHAVSRELTSSERRYPGLQRAYRNFCINCGRRMSAGTGKCPRCGFEIYDE